MKMAKADRKRFECNALPKGWTREEVVRRTGLSAGTKDIFYYRYSFVDIDCCRFTDN